MLLFTKGVIYMTNFIRMVGAEIKGIKNVNFGKIDFKTNFMENLKLDLGDVTGIYGQNGSGKSSFVDSAALLKDYLSGNNLIEYYDLININSDKCKLLFNFFCSINNKKYSISLTFSLTKIENKVFVSDEKIRYKELGNEEFGNLKTLIESSKKTLLGTSSIFDKFIKENEVDLKVCKKISEINGHSFIFSNDFLELLNKKSNEFIPILNILYALKKYAIIDLFVITNKNIGVINLANVFPLTMKTDHTSGSFVITKKEIIINENLYNEIKKVIDQINIVLKTIIPEMQLGLEIIKKDFISKDEINIILELLSIRNGQKISINNESEGIKKIISILSALIAAYNDEKVCLIVDEFDAGVFEYLLGELLYVLSGGMKGQIIFTSHNLRIMEKLDKDSIVLTTVNHDNRYTKFKHIKPTNNLRDVYIRELILNEQKEKLYEKTNNGDIEFALYKAGVFNERK